MEGYVWASRSIASNQISFRGVPRNDIHCDWTQAPLIKLTLAALSPPNTILPSAHVAKVVCLVARRWALPAPLATTHAAFNLREKRTG